MRRAILDENYKELKILVHLAAYGFRFRNGTTPLHLAIGAGLGRIVKILIKRGVDLNEVSAHGESPLSLAIKRKNREITKILIKGGAKLYPEDITPFEYSALHCAVLRNDTSAVKFLLDIGLDINGQKGVGYSSPMGVAIREGHVNIVKFLIDNGANLETKILCRMTALCYAAFYANMEMMELLLKAGARVNAQDENGYTPLHNVAAGGWMLWDEQRKLSEHLGMYVSPNDVRSVYPLSREAVGRQAMMAKLLIKYGADVKVRNRWKQTPLDVAKEMGFTKLAAILQKHRGT